MTPELAPAPKLEVQKQLNTNEDLSLEKLRGRVVAIFAFQMLCPGCVENSIPQARNVHAMFSDVDIAVLGLNTVFEHQYRIEFPVGIDMPSGNLKDPLPKTMRTYQLGGTPSLILIDRQGRLRKNKMGHEHDLMLGVELMALMREDS
jgi:peroxiredoxin